MNFTRKRYYQIIISTNIYLIQIYYSYTILVLTTQLLLRTSDQYKIMFKLPLTK